MRKRARKVDKSSFFKIYQYRHNWETIDRYLCGQLIEEIRKYKSIGGNILF